MRYSLAQRTLHWLIGLIVLGTLTSGMIFAILEFDGTRATFGEAGTNLLYKYHKTFGVIVLSLMLVRVAVKLRSVRPPYDPPLSRFNRIASSSLHRFFYAALILLPVSGWLGTGASGFPVEFFDWTLPSVLSKNKTVGEILFGVHGTIGWLVLIGVIVHIGAALKHWLVDRDSVMRRISLF